MGLHEILVNRPCVWILKELYEAEVVSKKAYSVKVSELSEHLKIDSSHYVWLLQKNGLLHSDNIGDDKVISLNQKGKDFFKLFDKLKVLTESQVKIIDEKPVAKVEYDLTSNEKKALFAVYKITKEVGPDLPINALIVENKKQEAVYDKLQKLNLIAKVKKGRGMTITLTPAGRKVLQAEFSERLK